MIRIVVGLSGASGAIYGVRLLERLHHVEEVETHLIVTRPAEKTLYQETGKVSSRPGGSGGPTVHGLALV